jgi:hypothetical protein
MALQKEDLPVSSLVLGPALITLFVTLVRLGGELLSWAPTFFSREAGGAGAIVGIVWLVPIFGVYFALKLLRLGHGPDSVGRAIGIPVLAFLLVPATIFVAMKIPLPSRIAVLGVGCIVALLVAILANWGTHYELGPPGFPEMAAIPKWFWIGLLPQLTLWMAFTVIVGALFGGLAVLVTGRRAAPVAG